MAHVAESKKKVVAEIVKLIKENPIVGVVNMENLPAPQLQTMRAQLRNTVTILMTKRRLINIALDQCKDMPGLEKLKEYLKGMPALLFTKENPFALCKRLQKNKSKAPAKAGQTAPNDIIVPAGPTPFQPGPIIGELAVIGIKSGVEDGKVAVKENSVVAKAGDVIKAEVASILTRLGIEPMEIGLDLVATYEKGEIFTKDVLSIDEQEYIDNLTKAATWSINLAIESAFPTKETTEMLIVKAFNDAKALAIEQNIISDLIAGDMIEKAEREMLSLKTDAKIETTEKPTEEKKEEAKPTDDKVAEMVEKTKEVTKDEPKAEEKKEESTDDKIAEMVKKTKDKMTGKEPKADDLLKEADKS